MIAFGRVNRTIEMEIQDTADHRSKIIA